MGELGGSLGVLLTDLGLRAGIWPALRGTGPVTVADLAARTGVAAPLLREWLRSQAAAGYLSHHPGTTGPDQDRFALPEPVAIALLDAPGGAIVGACTEMLISMAEHHDALGDAIAGDGGLGWDGPTFVTGTVPTGSPGPLSRRNSSPPPSTPWRASPRPWTPVEPCWMSAAGSGSRP